MKKVQNLFLLLIGFIALVFSVENSSIYAQDISNSSKKQCGWFNIGIGVSSWGDLAGGGSFSYQTERNLFSIRYTYSEDLNWFGSGEGYEYDLGVLYGRIAKAKYGFASVSAGIGFFGRGNSGRDFFTFGIPIEGQLFFTPLPFWGIGIYPFANLNLKDLLCGLLLCIQIGKLR